mmetsp:Transcript_79694/g.221769  ORF Transcript_79694/g.221769 Transcript_79694/m.221769 type:complete len:251 (+) Transcript_79694:210-962(+)
MGRRGSLERASCGIHRAWRRLAQRTLVDRRELHVQAATRRPRALRWRRTATRPFRTTEAPGARRGSRHVRIFGRSCARGDCFCGGDAAWPRAAARGSRNGDSAFALGQPGGLVTQRREGRKCRRRWANPLGPHRSRDRSFTRRDRLPTGTRVGQPRPRSGLRPIACRRFASSHWRGVGGVACERGACLRIGRDGDRRAWNLGLDVGTQLRAGGTPEGFHGRGSPPSGVQHFLQLGARLLGVAGGLASRVR